MNLKRLIKIMRLFICKKDESPPWKTDSIPVVVHPDECEEVIAWQHGLLDDISSLSDFLQPTNEEGYKAFYEQALALADKRHDLIHTDGQKLYYRNTYEKHKFYEGIDAHGRFINILPQGMTSWMDFYSRHVARHVTDYRHAYIKYVVSNLHPGLPIDYDAPVVYTEYRFHRDYVMHKLTEEIVQKFSFTRSQYELLAKILYTAMGEHMYQHDLFENLLNLIKTLTVKDEFI